MIALFTDFGHEGPYIGQMHAVLADQCPEIPVVSVFPDLPVLDIRAAAYLLPAYTQFLPEHSVCLCVVDPGVGSTRKGLFIKADGCWFVGPDNGLFTLISRWSSELEIHEISFQPGRVSSSFHGRDVFAPVAAMLAQGMQVPGRQLGPDEICLPDWPDNLYEVIYIDHYGNAITGIRAETVAQDLVLEISGMELSFARTFSDCPAGRCFWYENSNGLIEIAANQARAADLLELAIGSRVIK